MVPAEIEADWNRWYNEVHLPEITACPGFITSRRYVSDSGGTRRYVAVYALDGHSAQRGAHALNEMIEGIDSR